jgi:DNA-binding Xre family transcriptional regulator
VGGNTTEQSPLPGGKNPMNHQDEDQEISQSTGNLHLLRNGDGKFVIAGCLGAILLIDKMCAALYC